MRWTTPRPGITLVQTCFACPEQYDVFLDDTQIGYLRLRGGYFSAEYPDESGQLVFEHSFDEGFKGIFDSDEERRIYLDKAVEALLKAAGRNQ